MAWSTREKKPLRRSFTSLAEARRWRQEAQVGLRSRELDAPTPLTLAEAADEWLSGARVGVVRTRSGERYKPSAIRSYEAALRNYLLPEFGHLRLTAITRARIQDLADSLTTAGKAPATVANAILPLRAIYRRALDREQLTVNPTERLTLPRDRGKRDRIAEPAELSALLAALDDCHRVLWATAAYTGLQVVLRRRVGRAENAGKLGLRLVRKPNDKAGDLRESPLSVHQEHDRLVVERSLLPEQRDATGRGVGVITISPI